MGVARRGIAAALAFLCALVALPAAAVTNISAPAALFQSSLNGAAITVCDLYTGGTDHRNTSNYGIRGWPSEGAGTLSIARISTIGVSSGCVNLILSYTGSFSVDIEIKLSVSENVANPQQNIEIGPITVFANDPSLVVGEVSGVVTEEGREAHFPVRLITLPAATVTVAVTSLDAGEGAVSPSSLSFTTSDWNEDQTVTITGVDDGVADGDQTWSVRLNPASTGDSNYDGLANVDVAVTTLDQTGGPTQNGIAITSRPANNSGYRVGETIELRLDFSQAVAVTGTPLLALNIGDDLRQARYESGSGTTSLIFAIRCCPAMRIRTASASARRR